MSGPKQKPSEERDDKRHYFEADSISLVNDIASPRDGIMRKAFSGAEFLFFECGPWVGIECSRTGNVNLVPFTNVLTVRLPRKARK